MRHSIHAIANRTLRRGKHRLYLWPDVEADGSVDSKTPSKTDIKDEMGRLEKVSCPWRYPFQRPEVVAVGQEI